ncbi:hypothetical protein H1P_1140025 [Hyella patelloides LEGE 07179]|uniref:Uncharacterized protein n=1 Tax=Hyella patelloides LEGE 07179 TaxID=945734 RepID=A0A563VJT5_9CYAN|nr:hypothetical protein H1P_1140025 [Hyella patelloides LEGE 07179]
MYENSQKSPQVPNPLSPQAKKKSTLYQSDLVSIKAQLQ